MTPPPARDAAPLESLAPRFAPRWTLQSVLLAGTVTLGMFLLLPWMETLSAMPEADRTLREVETLSLPPPPAPPPPETVMEDAPRPVDVPEPRLDLPRRTLNPPRPQLDLNIELGEIGGDFAVDFQVGAADLAAQVEKMIFEIGELDQAPRPLARLNPVYPPRARMRRIEGEVVVEFVVTADGDVRDVTVTSSSPGDTFTAAALRAIRRWRFEPGVRGGEAVDTRVRQRVSFSLQ